MTVRLLGMTWDHARGHDSVVSASQLYAERFDVHIRWETRSLQSFGDASLEELASRYDLMVIDHPHVPVSARAGVLAPLDGCGFDDELAELGRRSVGPSHGSYTYAGRQWALSCDAAAQVSAHRPDQLEKPPGTWDEVMDLAAEGRVRWPLKPIDSYSSLLTLAAHRGTPPMTQPQVFLDREDLLATLDLLHRLAALVPAEDLDNDPVQVAEILCGDNRWCYSPLLFGYTNYSRTGYRPRPISYRDIPAIGGHVRGSLLGGAGIAVSGLSREMQAASTFAYWLCSAAVQRGVYFEAGGQPGNAVAWSDPALDAATLGFFSGTRLTLEGAYVRPSHVRYLAFQNRVAPWITQALGRDLSDDALVARIERAAGELLTEEAS